MSEKDINENERNKETENIPKAENTKEKEIKVQGEMNERINKTDLAENIENLDEKEVKLILIFFLKNFIGIYQKRSKGRRSKIKRKRKINSRKR